MSNRLKDTLTVIGCLLVICFVYFSWPGLRSPLEIRTDVTDALLVLSRSVQHSGPSLFSINDPKTGEVMHVSITWEKAGAP